jgi:FKBP-type peptidyl-prolyl cis-trans isomerase SlyD
MKIDNNKVVTLICELRENDKNGKVIDSYSKEEPLKFLAGSLNIIEAFEEKIMGKTIGDSFDFVLAAEDAFGRYEKENVIQIPYDSLLEANTDKTQELKIGHPIRVVDENDNEMMGEVTVINQEENQVTVDFNHPYAGMPVHFSGEVLEIRDASESEIDHGHAH